MSSTTQTIIAFILVGLAALTLIRRFFNKKPDHGCSACPTDKFKNTLKR
jgi:uncharacterized membrane protein YuzA (DUF378 family)